MEQALKVLSSEMDQAESRLILKAFLKGKESPLTQVRHSTVVAP